MPIPRFVPDPRLYLDREYCLAGGFDLPVVPAPAPLILHCYLWGPFTQHHALSIRSVLATQRPPFVVWLWLEAVEPSLPAGELRRTLEYSDRLHPGGALVVQHLDWLELARDTPHEGQPLPPSPVLRSNHLRHLAQAKHGGIYFDLDTVVLRDLRGLVGAGVVYQWAAQPYANSAICSFSPRDSMKLLEEGARRPWREGDRRSPYDPRELFRFDRSLPVDVLVLPVWLFDPLWIDCEKKRVRLEAFLDRPLGELPGFRLEALQRPGRLELEDWWPGAYAYHWHNGWRIPFHPGSPASILWRALERRAGWRPF